MGLVRTENQDAVFLPPEDQGPVPGLFVLADGMGGVAGGRVASELATNTIPRVFATESRENGLERGLTAAISAAAEAVFQKSQETPDFRGMGTTVVAVALEPGRAVVANVGDSRCYLWRKGELTLVTHDHSVVMEMVDQGQITLEQAREHPMRNVLTRVVGNQPVVEVDLFSVELMPDDQLLLCSDGLHGPVSEELISAVIGAENGPRGKTRVLVEEANRAGGPDNISAVLINIQDPGEMPEEARAASFLQLPFSRKTLALGLAAVLALGLLVFAFFFIPPKKQDNSHTPVIHGKVDAKELDSAKPLQTKPPAKAKPSSELVVPGAAVKANEAGQTEDPLASQVKSVEKQEFSEEPTADPPPKKLTEKDSGHKEPQNAPEPKETSPGLSPEEGENNKGLEALSSLAPELQKDPMLVDHIWKDGGGSQNWRQIGAYAKTANLKKDLEIVRKVLAGDKRVKLVWTIAPAKGKSPMLYRLLLGNSKKKGLKKSLSALGRKGVKPLDPPNLLAGGGRYSFVLSRVKDLKQAKPASSPELNLVFLAGGMADQAQIRTVTDIVKSGYPGGLLLMDYGAGREKTLSLALMAADILGHKRVFLYRSKRKTRSKDSQLLVPRKMVRDFCMNVTAALPVISDLPLTRRASLIMIKGVN